MSRKILFILLFIEAAGGVLFPPLISLLGKDIGLSPFIISSLFSILSVSLLASSFFFGTLSDKFGQKPILALTAFCGALAWFIIGYSDTFIGYAIGSALLGIAAASLPVVQSFFTGNESRANERTIILGTIGMIVGISAIIAPLAASFVQLSDYSQLCYIISALFCLEVLGLILFFPKSKKNIVRKEKIFSATKRLENHLALIPGYFAWFIFGIAMAGTNALFTIYMKDIIGIAARDIFFLFTAGGLITALSQNPGIKHFWFKVFNEKKIIFLCPMAVAAGFFLMAIPLLPVFLIGYFLEQGSRPVFRVTMLSDLAGKAASNHQGEALGTLSSISAISMIVGPLLFGAIFMIAPSLILVSAGICTLISIIFILLLLAQEEHLKTSPWKLVQNVFRSIF